ncbi:hypothetical protein [Kordiimonas sp.]|uniref:hypothetical protein n=1 Tax=Kordiimonas sp. TaxID=1970157 RepID=UPI003A955E1D
MKREILAGALLCLVACSTPDSVIESAAMQKRLSPVPVSIPKGQCALILTSRNTPTEPIFFQILGRRKAFVALDNKLRHLTLRRANNKLDNGLWLSQELEGHRLTSSLTLYAVSPAGPQEGDEPHYRGVVSLTRPDGWSTAMPVDGRLECQSRK